MDPIYPTKSFFSSGSLIPPDGIFEVTKAYNADKNPNKVNLGQGTYRDGDGKPWVLPSVSLAKEKVKNCGHEYLPIAGLKNFRDRAVELVFHGSKALQENRIASCQSLSGTGSLLLVGLALRKINPSPKTVFVTSPTWSNHELLFATQGFQIKRLPYYKDGAFDFQGYIGALKAAEPGSIIILHTCAHNPTGCDPSHEQWKDIAEVFLDRNLFPVFDSAYLGFNSGSVDEDAWVIRYFVEERRMEAAICLSFAKSMGLYGERIGLVEFVAQTSDYAKIVQSILENAQRATISNPPVYGAQIAAAVLGNEEIKSQWDQDLLTMSGRIKLMREILYQWLINLDTPGNWEHLVKQSGMFGYTGISPAQIEYLNKEFHVYMADTGRISIAGLNESNIEYFARALDSTVRKR